jgi:hypothetical protein
VLLHSETALQKYSLDLSSYFIQPSSVASSTKDKETLAHWTIFSQSKKLSLVKLFVGDTMDCMVIESFFLVHGFVGQEIVGAAKNFFLGISHAVVHRCRWGLLLFED